MEQYQDFKSITFTLAAGEERAVITSGCKYLTLYKVSSGASIQVKEKISNWEGGFTPLPYGVSVGFMSSRGVAFRNPGTTDATYTVLYGLGPFADNRQIKDPNSFNENYYDASDLSILPVSVVGFGVANLDNSGGGNYQLVVSAGDTTYNTKATDRVVVTEVFCLKIQTYTKRASGNLSVREFNNSGIYQGVIRSINYDVPAGKTIEYDLLQGQPWEPSNYIGGCVGVYITSDSIAGYETKMKAYTSRFRARFKT